MPEDVFSYDEARYLDIEDTKADNATPNIQLMNVGVTKFDEKRGYADGYEYSQNYKYKMTDMTCLPDEIKDIKFYHPSEFGNEKNVKIRLANIKKLKEKIGEENKKH